MKNKVFKMIAAAVCAMCLGVCFTAGQGVTFADGEDTGAMKGVEIKSVQQTALAQAKSNVLIPLDVEDFSKLRSIEIEIANPTDKTQPFSFYLQDKMNCRTLGCYGGHEADSYDEWTMIATDGTETKQKGYYNCTFIPAGFQGKIRLPMSFFKSSIEFRFDKRPGMMFDYFSVEYLVVAVDQYYNPGFVLNFGDIVLKTPTEDVLLRDGALGADGIIIQHNQLTEGTYTTVTSLS